MHYDVSLRSDGVVEIYSRGFASAPYDRAFFGITVSQKGSTSSKAKREMEDAVNQVTAYIDDLIKRGLAKNKVVALKVAPSSRYVGNEREFDGYLVSMKIKFETEDVKSVVSIQDRLTEFPKSEVETVRYGFKDADSLRSRALTDAKDRVEKRWKEQHSLFGARGEEWEPQSWAVDYEEREPISKVAAPTGNDEPGIATIVVTLGIAYQRAKRP
jgi:uncharacterized protein YggE